MPAKKPHHQSPDVLTADDFHALEGGGRALFLVPRTGFALSPELDDFLAFVVRCFPLSVGPGHAVVDPSGVVDVDDLDRAHRALRDFLAERGYQLPQPLHDAAAMDFSWPDWIPIGNNKEERLEQLERLEHDLRAILTMLSGIEVPSIATLLRDDDDGRRRLDELVLELLRRAVETLPEAGQELDLRGTHILQLLRVVPAVEWPEDLAARAEALRKQHPADDFSLTAPDAGPSPWW